MPNSTQAQAQRKLILMTFRRNVHSAGINFHPNGVEKNYHAWTSRLYRYMVTLMGSPDRREYNQHDRVLKTELLDYIEKMCYLRSGFSSDPIKRFESLGLNANGIELEMIPHLVVLMDQWKDKEKLFRWPQWYLAHPHKNRLDMLEKRRSELDTANPFVPSGAHSWFDLFEKQI